jgi:ATP-binding cassette subfamily F protein 3
MVQLQNLTVSFTGRELYRNIDLFVAADSRIGLVGPNGSGKSTLFRLIRRDLEPDEGTIDIRRDLKIGWLPQTGVVLKDRTVLAEAMSAFKEVEQIDQELEQLEQKLQKGSHDSEVLDRYTHLQQERNHAGYAHEAQARKVLAELGFTNEDCARPTGWSSGGFQVRIALAKLLLEEPDLLLLDEPTNYLDIKAIAWLQEYLQSFSGAYVLITHDRYLLDACVERIWSIERPNVVVYKGNYSSYSGAREERLVLLEKAAQEQQKEIERAERFIEQFRARKDTAKRVKSRQKALDRMERIVMPEKRKRLRLRFPEAATIYGQVVALEQVAQRYGDHAVLSGVSLIVAASDRIGLFGANGEGKTTLLRIMSGDLSPSSGLVRRSEKLQIAFYRQGAEEMLDPSLEVIDEARKEAEGYTVLELRSILGAFLFSGDDIYKPVSVLSGGEKTRLALLKVLLRPSNLLLLDEPTNHLDIDSREVLEEAISDYRNTVIFAAHDRFMIDRLANKTVAVRNGHADVFPGNYTYATSAGKPMTETVSVPKPKPPQPAPRSQETRARPAQPAPRRPAPASKDETALLQSRIRALEEKVQALDTEFQGAKQHFDFVRARELWNVRQSLIDELTALRNQE